MFQYYCTRIWAETKFANDAAPGSSKRNGLSTPSVRRLFKGCGTKLIQWAVRRMLFVKKLSSAVKSCLGGIKASPVNFKKRFAARLYTLLI